jgi:hypothetical protein
VRALLHEIPAEECERWATGESGPWEYLAGQDMENAQVILDEAHNIIPSSGMTRDASRAWLKWVSLCRQRGMSLHLISQDERSICKWVLSRVHVRREIVSYSCERDPLFGIPYGDWYTLRGSLWYSGGTVVKRSFVLEYQQIAHRWIPTEGGDEFRFDPDLFGLYNSYAFANRRASGDEPVMGRWEAVRWFLGRWWWHMLNRPHIRAVLVVSLLVATSGGSIGLAYAMGAVKRAAAQATRVEISGAATLQEGLSREPLSVPSMTPSGPPLLADVPEFPGVVVLDMAELMAARRHLSTSVAAVRTVVESGGEPLGVGPGGVWLGAPVNAWVRWGAVVGAGVWNGWTAKGVKDGAVLFVRGSEYRMANVRVPGRARAGAGAPVAPVGGESPIGQ